jgi:hypothetical protein
VADQPRRYLIEIHPKTGEHAARDTQTGELLDISDCVRLLNEHKPPARHSASNGVA